MKILSPIFRTTIQILLTVAISFVTSAIFSLIVFGIGSYTLQAALLLTIGSMLTPLVYITSPGSFFYGITSLDAGLFIFTGINFIVANTLSIFITNEIFKRPEPKPSFDQSYKQHKKSDSFKAYEHDINYIAIEPSAPQQDHQSKDKETMVQECGICFASLNEMNKDTNILIPRTLVGSNVSKSDPTDTDLIEIFQKDKICTDCAPSLNSDCPFTRKEMTFFYKFSKDGVYLGTENKDSNQQQRLKGR